MKQKTNFALFIRALILTGSIFCAANLTAQAQTSVFTYQGRLTDSGTPSAIYDLQFALDNNATLLTCNGAAAINNICEDVPVSNGVFTVRLDFGTTAFDGASRTLQIGVRRGAETGAFIVLTPNQPLTSTPYALQSRNATRLGNIAANNYLQTTGSGENLTNLNATNITEGTLDDRRLPVNVALRNTANTFAAPQTINSDLLQTGTIANLNLTNGFLARGTLGTGLIPATGAGVRMMFYPNKAAFRAGQVDGTQWDEANIGNLSIALGSNVRATGRAAFAAGENTTASGGYSTALGRDTTASGFYSTALGYETTANDFASTALGQGTTASGNYSTAMGNYASTNNFEGSFVYGDRSTNNLLNASAEHQFNVRASGGYRLFTNAAMTNGVVLSAGGGSWGTLSDRNAKENFGAVDSRDVLRKVLSLPISTWSYKGQSYRHIGATAQDFYQTFEVGENDTTITTVDPDGVALAAIQGLNEELKDRDRQIEAQRRNLNDLQEQVKQQQAMIDGLKKLFCSQTPQAEICK